MPAAYWAVWPPACCSDGPGRKDGLTMESIKNLLRSVKTRLVITALVVIATGVLFVLKPGTSGTWICYIVGAALCVSGVVRFITYFLGDFRKSFGSFDLVWGAALLLCGVYILVRPSLLYGLLTTAFAIFLVVDGVLKLQYAIDLYRMKAKGWWFVLAVALVMGVLGVVALFNPFATMVTLMTFLGITLIADGVMDLVSIAYVHAVAKRVEQVVDDAYAAATAIETDGEVKE